MACPQAEQSRARVASALARYPDIDAADVDQIKTWFKNEASALDVALLASDPTMADAYRQFCADHIDRFSLADLVKAGVFVVAVALVIAVLVWRVV